MMLRATSYLGAIGSGKTYLNCVLRIAAVRQFLTVKYIQLLNLLVDFSIAQGNGTMKMMRSRGGTSITMYANDNYSLGDNMLLQGRCDYCLPADCTEGSPIDRFPAAQTHRGGECPQRAA